MRRVQVVILVVGITLGTGLPAVATGPTGPASKAGPRSVLTDFNGDGYADLAIGVPFEDVGPVQNAGAVHVLYGSATGLQATTPNDQLWTQDSPGVLDLAEGGDQFGSSLAAGDFNGDGYADLAVGVPFENVGPATDAGAVHILYGSAAGLQATVPDDQWWSQDSPSVLDSAESGDNFGYSVAAGDFNGDGYADLVVGVPFEDVVTGTKIPDAGSVSILYGTAAGLQAVSPDDQYWTQGIAGVQDFPEASDRWGWSASTGDFNGDGFDDLVAGAPYEDVGTEFRGIDAGAVNVLFGSASGLQATAPNDQFWHQDSPNIEGLAEHQDEFGYSVATGDFDRDGFDDLATGVRREDGVGESIPQSGGVNILYGSAGGLQTARDWHMEQGERFVGDAAEPRDHFGWAVAIGDFDANGFADLAVGVPFEEVAPQSDVGAVHVLYSTAMGLQAENPDDKLWTQDSPDVIDLGEPTDRFGSALGGPTSAP